MAAAKGILERDDYLAIIQSLKAENSKLKQDNLRLGQTVKSMRKDERGEGSSRTTAIAWPFQETSNQSSTTMKRYSSVVIATLFYVHLYSWIFFFNIHLILFYLKYYCRKSKVPAKQLNSSTKLQQVPLRQSTLSTITIDKAQPATGPYISSKRYIIKKSAHILSPKFYNLKWNFSHLYI